MKNKIPVCEVCGKICKEGELIEMENTGEGYLSYYLSDCCEADITYYDNIKEIILKKLE